MPTTVPWPAAGALLAGVVSLSFIRYLWPHRGNLGARFFIATIACEALWALSYGAALLVFDPALRRLFELPIWLGINFIGVFFLAFALEYTGRGHLVRSPAMGAVVLVQVVHTVVVATNPLHHIAWRGYQIEPVFGAATVSYVHGPWLFLNFAGLYLLVAAGSFLLFDTFFSYGPLYRAQAAAIALSPVLPGLAFLLWLFEVGEFSALNLTPLTFPIHLGFDMYAFFRRDMFDLTPATRRAGERAALDDLGSAVVIVNDGRRIVDANAEARRILADGDLLGRRLGAVLGDVDLPAEGTTVSITAAGERREYAVATSPLEGAAGNEIGSTVVLQDITAQKQREQRLAVLNRVLRHNLRNDLNVVRGTVDLAAERADDGEVRELLSTADEKTAAVLELGEKAREIEAVLDTEPSATEPVAVADLLADLDAVRSAEETGGRVGIDVPKTLRLRSDRELLARVFGNLIENGLEHNTADEPTVEVALVGTPEPGDAATFEVRDDGPGLPDHERRAIERGEETALEHGSGLGLWLVKWGVTALGGDLAFEVDGTGTTVRLRLPTVVAADAGDARGAPEG